MVALTLLCQQLEVQYQMRIHCRNQWDNATPHTESLLKKVIEEEFGKRGWVWTMQPANSPLTNLMDAAIFPALAKKGSAIQGVRHHGRYLQCEKIWEVLQEAWENYPCESIARAFVHHAQVAAAIYDCKGGDDFVKERKGLSFGVRKVCRPYYGEEEDNEDTGLDLASLAPRPLYQRRLALS